MERLTTAAFLLTSAMTASACSIPPTMEPRPASPAELQNLITDTSHPKDPNAPAPVLPKLETFTREGLLALAPKEVTQEEVQGIRKKNEWPKWNTQEGKIYRTCTEQVMEQQGCSGITQGERDRLEKAHPAEVQACTQEAIQNNHGDNWWAGCLDRTITMKDANARRIIYECNRQVQVCIWEKLEQ